MSSGGGRWLTCLSVGLNLKFDKVWNVLITSWTVNGLHLCYISKMHVITTIVYLISTPLFQRLLWIPLQKRPLDCYSQYTIHVKFINTNWNTVLKRKYTFTINIHSQTWLHQFSPGQQNKEIKRKINIYS